MQDLTCSHVTSIDDRSCTCHAHMQEGAHPILMRCHHFCHLGTQAHARFKPSDDHPGQGRAWLLPEWGECVWTVHGVPRAQLFQCRSRADLKAAVAIVDFPEGGSTWAMVRAEPPQAGNRARKRFRRCQ
eukprot:3937274-Rhodomonas_salina.1